jgi:F0F1-type ATP synthase assembly protein I
MSREPDPRDPLAGAQADAQRAIEEAEARLRAIEDAPTGEAPPPIPEVLGGRAKSDAKEPSRTARVSAGVSELSKSLAIGLDFLWMLAAGGFLGWLADRAMGKGHVGILIGLGLGFGFGTWRLLKRLNAPEPRGRKGSSGSR